MRTQSLSLMAVVQENMKKKSMSSSESFLSPFGEYCLYQHQMKQLLWLRPLIQRGHRSLPIPPFRGQAASPAIQDAAGNYYTEPGRSHEPFLCFYHSNFQEVPSKTLYFCLYSCMLDRTETVNVWKCKSENLCFQATVGKELPPL